MDLLHYLDRQYSTPNHSKVYGVYLVGTDSKTCSKTVLSGRVQQILKQHVSAKVFHIEIEIMCQGKIKKKRIDIRKESLKTFR